MRIKDKRLLEKIIVRVCKSAEVELYDWQLTGRPNSQTLSVYIYTREGVTIDDCAKVSESLSDELDMEDIFHSRYFLEVSSPGLERELREPKQFTTAVGDKIEVQYQDEDNQERRLAGKLIKVGKDFIEVKASPESQQERIFYSQIKKARTKFVWPEANPKRTKGKGS
jgi:ribosome maturation factor RimP